MAKVILHRSKRLLGSSSDLKVFVNGEHQANLKDAGFAALELPEGSVSLQVKGSILGVKSDVLDLELREQDLLEFQVRVSPKSLMTICVITGLGFFTGMNGSVFKGNYAAYILIAAVIVLPSLFINDLVLVPLD